MKCTVLNFTRFCISFTLGLLTFIHTSHASRAPKPPSFIYEIFTQSFQDSNGDQVGDLEGVRSRLDYISSLGADAIWLTPIFESPSYHGYDVSDYESIKRVYGDITNLKNLLADAHARNIRVLLDLPINHTSIQNDWFNHQDFYLWSPVPLWLPNQWFPLNGEYYFSSFSPRMPDLNWRNPAVLTQVEAVFSYWTTMGIDGFRLDAAKFLVKGPRGEQNTPETHAIWKKITNFVKKSFPETYFIGEVWDSFENIAAYYGNGDELDAAFDFPVEDALRSSIHTQNSAVLVDALNHQIATARNPRFAAPFAGNHDLPRLASVLDLNLSEQMLAALLVFALPGTPVVYYGDEIGMPAGDSSQFPGDLSKRTPMDWSEVDREDQDEGSLLNAYRELARLRHAHPALFSGTISQVQNLSDAGISFLRTDPMTNESVQVVLNLGETFLTVEETGSVIYGSISNHQLGPKQGAILLKHSQGDRPFIHLKKHPSERLVPRPPLA